MPESTTTDQAPAKAKKEWSIEEKVEYLRIKQWTDTAIARKCKVSKKVVRDIIDRITDEKITQLREGSDERRAFHVAYLEAIAKETEEAYRKNKKESGGRGNPRIFRVGIEALAQARQITGDNAPSKSVTQITTTKTVVTPRLQRELLDADPIARDLILQLKARSRQLAFDRPIDVGSDGSGRVQHPDQPGGEALGAGTPLRDPESISPEGDGRGNHEADHRGASPPW